jgi:hypothetical protein
MNLQCGYLPGTNSSLYHPIQNVKFWGDKWKTCRIVVNDKTIKTIMNENISYEIDINFNSKSYNVGLFLNNKIIYEHKYLYHAELVFDGTPEYEFKKTMLIDH